MFGFHKEDKCKKCEEIERELIDIILIQAEAILNLTEKPKAHSVRLVLTTIINQSKFTIMSLVLKNTEKSIGNLSLLDNVTGQPVAGATFSNIQATSDAVGVVTATVNPDGSVTVSGVAPGSANVTVTADVAYTDSTGNAQTGNLSSTIAVSVTVAADGVSLVVTFGTPIPQ